MSDLLRPEECDALARASEPCQADMLGQTPSGPTADDRPEAPTPAVSDHGTAEIPVDDDPDSWQRSGLPAGDFAPLVGLSKHTLYAWKKQFDQQGPAGLMDQPRGVRTGSRLPEITKRSILLLKQSHPDWGCQRISDMLLRGHTTCRRKPN